MKLASIRPGDLVLVDRRGRRFHALVTAAGDELSIEPIERGITYRTARAREVLVHWRRAGRARSRDRDTCREQADLFEPPSAQPSSLSAHGVSASTDEGVVT